MCGIAGLVRLDGTPPNPAQLDRLTDSLAHRGPDDRGTYRHAGVGLGFRRLAIIDLSRDANQPMVSADGRFALVFNGEIYNFREKRELLLSYGYTFRTQSDSEVLLGLYERFQEGCLQHLRGMFAFAVFDKALNRLFIARDRLGQKPLKYFYHRGVFAFASELKALRSLPECPDEIDQEAIYHYLTTMYLPSPWTGVVGIHKLPAAHHLSLQVGSGDVSVARYWSLDYRQSSSADEEACAEQVRAGLADSVRMRMVSDVPVGAFLSGGVDSAAVVGLMSEASSEPVRTFSIGSDDPRFDELPEAEEIARHFQCRHQAIPLEADIVRLLPTLVATYDEPFADTSCIPTYLVSQYARREVTVVLNGDGGDESFAGYVRYPILAFSESWRALPGPLHGLARAGTWLAERLMPTTLTYRADRFQRSIHQEWPERYLQYLSYFTEEEKRALYRDGALAGFPPTAEWYATSTRPARERASDLVHQAMSMDIDTYLAEDLLPKVDLGSMAHGLEARSPFLDHTFMEAMAHMPVSFKIRGRARKILLKRALRGLVPEKTLHRPKRGFRLPLDRWFRGSLSGFVHERLLDPGSRLWDFFDRPAMERFLSRYFESRIDYSDHVWSLLWFQEWLTMQGQPTTSSPPVEDRR